MDVIRKISVGPNPKDSMVYYVGMRAGGGNVSFIEEDERALYKHNIRRYNVYIETEEHTALWKTVESSPVVVEYDCRS